jgi:hypothetical protein
MRGDGGWGCPASAARRSFIQAGLGDRHQGIWVPPYGGMRQLQAVTFWGASWGHGQAKRQAPSAGHENQQGGTKTHRPPSGRRRGGGLCGPEAATTGAGAVHAEARGGGGLAGGGRSLRARGLGRLGLPQEAIKRALDEAGLLLLPLLALAMQRRCRQGTPAMVHGFHRRQADHPTHPGVEAGRNADQPDVGWQKRGRLLRGVRRPPSLPGFLAAGMDTDARACC